MNAYTWNRYNRFPFFFIIPVVSFLSCGFLSCGGGGGVYFPPQVSINEIGLRQIKFHDENVTGYHKQFFPVAYSERTDMDKIVNAGKELFGKYCYFQEVNFNGTDYYVKESRCWFNDIEIIRKQDMHIVSDAINCPRYIYAFSSFVINFDSQEYLVIYVRQQPTSHSSTLFLLNSEFQIVYQEHLLGALEIGTAFSEKFGQCFVIKSEDWWFEHGTDKPKVDINGNWLYYIETGPTM
jgi:hypothetical protein